MWLAFTFSEAIQQEYEDHTKECECGAELSCTMSLTVLLSTYFHRLQRTYFASHDKNGEARQL